MSYSNPNRLGLDLILQTKSHLTEVCSVEIYRIAFESKDIIGNGKKIELQTKSAKVCLHPFQAM